MRLAISSGHGKYVRGAAGILDEVDEARRVVKSLCEELTLAGHDVTEIHDDVSHTQDENLEWLVDAHNRADRDLDISVHFNAYEQTSKPMGCEVLYVTQQELADEVSHAISQAGELIDRGPKYRDNLYFLNNTDGPAILIETCFVDSQADAELYEEHFRKIVKAIAGAVIDMEDLPELPAKPDLPKVYFSGKASWFGGPQDEGVSPSEGLAFIYSVDTAPDLFLEKQPPGTTGLARRLDPEAYYVAARWDYDVPGCSKAELADQDRHCLVRANGRMFLAQPADWGPHSDTGRVLDLSPGLLAALGLETDEGEVEMVYPVTKIPPMPPVIVPPEDTNQANIEIVTEGDVYITVNGQPVRTRD